MEVRDSAGLGGGIKILVGRVARKISLRSTIQWPVNGHDKYYSAPRISAASCSKNFLLTLSNTLSMLLSLLTATDCDLEMT